MATRMSQVMVRARAELCHEPTEKRVRAALGGVTVVDTTRARLVWEPRRIVPSYAVPSEELRAELAPGTANAAPRAPVLHPGIPFAAHSSDGETLDVSAGGATRAAAAFRSADRGLAGYVVLDFKAFDWHEEDEAILSHPRDPYHRVDVRASSRHVEIRRDGRLLAESTRPTLVFETQLPARFYLPRADVRVELAPSDRRTRCPYKGEASYFSVEIEGGRRADLVWCYERPLFDAAPLAGLLAFFDEEVDVVVDGQPRPRPRTVIPEEVGITST